METAQKICHDSDCNEVIGIGPTISLSELKGRSGYFSKKKGAEFLLRCTKQLETQENWQNRIYAVNIGLGQIVEGDEGASPECLSLELLPGYTAEDAVSFVQEAA